MMKVLHVIDKMDPERGGVCQAVRTIALGLHEKEIHNEIVSVDHQDAAFLETDFFKIHALGPADNPWGYSKKLCPWLNEHLSTFDVVIVHGLWQYPSYATHKTMSQIKKSINKTNVNAKTPKLFVMPHGMLDPYFQKAPGRKLKALRNVLYWKYIENHVINHADGVLFTCEAERQLAHVPFKPYRPKNELVVGLGVEAPPPFEVSMETTFKKHCPELNSEPYILFLSRIHEKKGVDILLHAYLKVARSLVEGGNTFGSMPKLVIAGPGIETPYGKKITEIVNSDEALKGNVLFPGMLKGDAKWGAFYGCEAFILPSHQENFGIAVVEALACSKPVLISNQVNIWTEIAHAGGGLVGDDTIEGTFESIKSFIDLSSHDKETMNAKARACFETYFAVEQAAKNMLNAISL